MDGPELVTDARSRWPELAASRIARCPISVETTSALGYPGARLSWLRPPAAASPNASWRWSKALRLGEGSDKQLLHRGPGARPGPNPPCSHDGRRGGWDVVPLHDDAQPVTEMT